MKTRSPNAGEFQKFHRRGEAEALSHFEAAKRAA